MLTLAGPLAAQPPAVPFGQGTHALRRILTDLELQPVDGFKAIDTPERTLVVVLGETDRLDELPGGVEGFVRAGGALLVATDRMTKTDPLDTAFGVTVLAVTASRPGDDAGRYTYRSSDDCPLIYPAAGGDNLLFRRPPLPGLPALLQRVATNRPACLSVKKPGLTVAASLPPGCQYATAGRVWWMWVDGRIAQPFAARGAVGAGRVLVLADHSLFINDLLLQDDNDNIDFTYNCLDWLLDGTPHRDRVVFVEEDVVKTNLDVPLKDLPAIRPPWNKLPPVVNGLVASMETPTDRGRTPLEEMTDAVDPQGQMSLLAGIVGTLLFGVYGLYRISSGRFRPEQGVPLLPTALARQQVQHDALEQRRRALLAGGNLWEAARGLCRTAFEPASGEGAEPVFRADGGWWRRWTLPARARRLWRLAFGRQPLRVTRGEFGRLPGRVEEVRAALAAGTLRISSN